ncbi:MAG: class I SAM-dependent rRNA methyltransferase [Nannocystaceae bacterium]|nr:class I SAM-dependent rRNA methyltransferase [Nannocystaceae bacterium]
MRRRVDESAIRLSHAAARGLRSGHPWVFRDSLVRSPAELAAGACVKVADEDGVLLGWGLFEPEGAIALRVVSRAEHFVWDKAAIAARVDEAARLRERHLGDGLGTACRLVHGEGDGLPGLAVDRLGDYLLIFKYSRAAEAWLDTLVEVLQDRFAPAGVYMQDRLRPVSAEDRRPPAFHLAGKVAPPEFEVEEDGLRFLIDVTAPVSPGLFLDLREGRRMVERLAGSRRVLNLFSFTGAFGIRAVRGGASEVFNVDAAARSHARCRQNLQASGLDPQACTPLDGDAFKHLERLRVRSERFDLVVVDPPPFSRVGNKVFSALRNWQDLMAAIVQVVAPGGLVLAVSNASKLPEDELMQAIGLGAVAGGRDAVVIGECGLPPDFPVPPAFVEGRYLKVKLLRVG